MSYVYGKVFGFGRNYAYMLIDSAEAVQALPKSAHNRVQSEYAARELVKVPQEERAQVVESVIARNVPVTARAIREAANPAPVASSHWHSSPIRPGEKEEPPPLTALAGRFTGIRLACFADFEEFARSKPHKIPNSLHIFIRLYGIR